jgi:streptogramin lyase
MNEFALQKFTAALLRLNAKGVIWFHPANGESRSPRTGGRLKAMGVRRGVPDFVIVPPSGQVCFLELKSAAGRMSPEQKAFRDDCASIGCPYEVAKTSAEVEHILREWGVIGRPTQPIAIARAA